MKITTTEFTQTPGIYVWENVTNGKVYVGQSINVFKRVQGELYQLRRGNFHNDHMQRAWNKYGEDAFVLTQVMECEVYELDDAEALWGNFYDARNPENGYNLREYGQDNHGHHEITRQKMSESQRARFDNNYDVDQIMHYYNIGLHYAEIERLTGVTTGTIQTIIRQNEDLIENITLSKVEAYEAVKAGILTPKRAAALCKTSSIKLFKRDYATWLNSGSSNPRNHADEIVRDFESGMMQKTLAAKYQTSATTIRTILMDAGAI